MAQTIEIPEDLSERLAAAGIPADDASRHALSALTDLVDYEEARTWWNSLSAEEQRAERERTLASSAAGRSGRTRTADEVVARIRAKYSAEPAA